MSIKCKWLASCALSAVLAVSAHAGSSTSAVSSAYFSFSGGNGSPITMTLDDAIVVDIAVTPGHTGFIMAVEDVGSVAWAQFGTSTVNMTYSGNANNYAMDYSGNGVTSGTMLEPTDLYFMSRGFLDVQLQAGDVVTINPGTYTMESLAGSSVVSGNYGIFFFDGHDTLIDTTAVQVPEPASFAALAAFAALGVSVGVRRRRNG